MGLGHHLPFSFCPILLTFSFFRMSRPLEGRFLSTFFPSISAADCEEAIYERGTSYFLFFFFGTPLRSLGSWATDEFDGLATVSAGPPPFFPHGHEHPRGPCIGSSHLVPTFLVCGGHWLDPTAMSQLVFYFFSPSLPPVWGFRSLPRRSLSAVPSFSRFLESEEQSGRVWPARVEHRVFLRALDFYSARAGWASLSPFCLAAQFLRRCSIVFK